MTVARRIRFVIPLRLQPVFRRTHYKLFRLRLRLLCWCRDLARNRVADAPMPPALLRFKVSELLSSREFRRIGEGCARLVAEHAGAAGVELSDCRRVLDFGCGCGRVLVWLLRQYPNVEFHGADVDADCVNWCGRHLESARFVANSRTPPLPYPSDHFDFVYCFSVFTHLDEPTQDLWLAELRRVILPGGLLLLTVHGERAARILDSNDRAELDSSGFLFKQSAKLNGIMPGWYQTTWHSQQYVVAHLSKWYRDIRYTVIPDGSQDLVTARRPLEEED